MRVFRYALAPLESLYAYQLECARRELAQAHEKWSEAKDRQAPWLEAWNQRMAERATILVDPVHQQLLRQQTERDWQGLQEAMALTEACKGEYEAAQQRLELARQRCEMLEKHKMQARTSHDKRTAHEQAAWADDAWLVRRGRYDAI